MQLPPLPTDNLYKFCAIAGVVLYLFGATYPLQKTLDLQLRLADDSTNIDITKARQQFLITDQSQLKHDLERVTVEAEKLTHEEHVSGKELAGLESDNDATSKRVSTLTTTSRNVQENILKLKGEAQKSRILSSHLTFISIICIGSMVVGFILIAYGFIAWYVLVQVPLDKILANQAKGKHS